MEIQRDFKNLLLRRREVTAVIECESNPGFDKVKEGLVHKLKVDKELAVIKKLESRFGRKEFVVNAFIYNSVSDRDKIEPKIKAKVKAEKPVTKDEKAGETKEKENKVKLEEKQEEKK